MNLKKRFMNRLEGKSVDITPVGSTTSYCIVELMKKCGAERPLADTDPVAMARLALAGHEILGFEWIEAMGWDCTAMSEVFGCVLGEPTIDIPCCVREHPFAGSLDGLDYPANFLERGRFPVYKEQFRLLKEKIGEDLAVFGSSEGAWTCACHLVGIERFMKWTIKAPDKVRRVLDVAKQAMIDVVNFAFDNGADYYLLPEPSSSPDLISPAAWKRFVQPVITEVVSRAKGPVVLHVCGNVDRIIGMMCETGAAGISVEEQTDMKRAVEIAHENDVRVFGAVGTATTLFMGSPEECYRESIACLENGVDFLTPGCGIAPHSPMENVLQLRKARDDFFRTGKWKRGIALNR